ncbi:MAG: hypothetical protein ABS916_05255 [Carnobacterium sp.]
MEEWQGKEASVVHETAVNGQLKQKKGITYPLTGLSWKSEP